MTKIITFKKSNGERIKARLISENKKTAWVYPHLWVKSKPIKIHKLKTKMKHTNKTI